MGLFGCNESIAVGVVGECEGLVLGAECAIYGMFVGLTVAGNEGAVGAGDGAELVTGLLVGAVS